ncbi:hypothetical protein N665_0089s0017 [Sinapis alba]|nr:hypothetical protein N665_0089s0017 [Sinapis alba]
MVKPFLTKRCSVFMMVMFFLILFMAHVSNANTEAICVKDCPNQCMKDTRDVNHSVCEKVCKKRCNEEYGINLNRGKYVVPPEARPHIGCRWLNLGCT